MNPYRTPALRRPKHPLGSDRALSGERSVPLVRGRADEIESARAGVDEFLRDNGVGERGER